MDTASRPAIPLTYIPPSVRRDLSYHLDDGTSANWEALAERLQMKVLLVGWIGRGVCCRDGWTARLLEECQASVTVEQLLIALKEIGNLPAYDKLQEAYPEILSWYERRTARPVADRCREQEQEPVVHREMPVQNDVQLLQSNCVSHDILSGESQESESLVQDCLQAVNQRFPSMLLTHGEDGRSHCLKVYQWLLQNKFVAKVITRKDSQFAENMTDYINLSYQKASFIIILISRGYLKEIQQPTDAECRRSLTTGTSHLITRYIHQLMQTEMFEAGCKNGRFIPLLLNGMKRDDVPLPLRNTRIYSWPSGCQKLFEFLVKSSNK